jgi:hypothetical protein
MGSINAAGIWIPDETDTGKPHVYLATMAQSIQDGLGIDTDWVGITPDSGFTASQALAYRKIGKVVYIRGAVTKTAGNFLATGGYEKVFTMPVGYRIAVHGRFAGATYQTPSQNTPIITLNADGSVNIGFNGGTSNIVYFGILAYPV